MPSNRPVTCIHCGTKTKIPDSKVTHRLQTTLAYLSTKNWVFFGKSKGSCPDCNLLAQKEPVKDLAAVLEGGL